MKNLKFYSTSEAYPGQLSRYNDSLRAGRSRDPIPVRARIFAPVLTGPGVNPASYKMDTGSLSLG